MSTRRSLAGHWFDYDQNGTSDLLIINDFAENELYLHSELGKLVKTEYPPLTDSGFSMGVSIVDLRSGRRLRRLCFEHVLLRGPPHPRA